MTASVTPAARAPAGTMPDLSCHEAMLALCKSGLTIVSEAPGAWDALPAAARERFGDAFFSMSGAEHRVHDIAQERDDERAGLDKAIAGLRERDTTIKALRFEARAKGAALRRLLVLCESSLSPDSDAVRPALDAARAALAAASPTSDEGTKP